MEGGKNRHMGMGRGRGVSTSERREKGQPSLRGIQIILRAANLQSKLERTEKGVRGVPGRQSEREQDRSPASSSQSHL